MRDHKRKVKKPSHKRSRRVPDQLPRQLDVTIPIPMPEGRPPPDQYYVILKEGPYVSKFSARATAEIVMVWNHTMIGP